MTLTDLETRVFQRLEEDIAAPSGFTAAEVIHAINQAYYLLVFLTLCLEKTAAITLSPPAAVFGIRGQLPDYLVPLRLVSGDPPSRVRPASIRDLDARHNGWQIARTDPNHNEPLARYGTLGMNLFLVTPPPSSVTTAQLTYAYVPAALAVGSDIPLVPESYHESLIKFALPWLRLKEGAQEFQKVIPLFKEFLADAAKLGNYVRARSRAAGYDRLPFELDRFDVSRLFKEVAKRRPSGEPAAG